MKDKKQYKRGRPLTYVSLQRFFKKAWTLEEAQAYEEGVKAMLPENVQLLKLIQLQREASS